MKGSTPRSARAKRRSQSRHHVVEHAPLPEGWPDGETLAEALDVNPLATTLLEEMKPEAMRSILQRMDVQVRKAMLEPHNIPVTKVSLRAASQVLALLRAEEKPAEGMLLGSLLSPAADLFNDAHIEPTQLTGLRLKLVDLALPLIVHSESTFKGLRTWHRWCDEAFEDITLVAVIGQRCSHAALAAAYLAYSYPEIAQRYESLRSSYPRIPQIAESRLTSFNPLSRYLAARPDRKLPNTAAELRNLLHEDTRVRQAEIEQTRKQRVQAAAERERRNKQREEALIRHQEPPGTDVPPPRPDPLTTPSDPNIDALPGVAEWAATVTDSRDLTQRLINGEPPDIQRLRSIIDLSLRVTNMATLVSRVLGEEVKPIRGDIDRALTVILSDEALAAKLGEVPRTAADTIAALQRFAPLPTGPPSSPDQAVPPAGSQSAGAAASYPTGRSSGHPPGTTTAQHEPDAAPRSAGATGRTAEAGLSGDHPASHPTTGHTTQHGHTQPGCPTAGSAAGRTAPGAPDQPTEHGRARSGHSTNGTASGSIGQAAEYGQGRSGQAAEGGSTGQTAGYGRAQPGQAADEAAATADGGTTAAADLAGSPGRPAQVEYGSVAAGSIVDLSDLDAILRGDVGARLAALASPPASAGAAVPPQPCAAAESRPERRVDDAAETVPDDPTGTGPRPATAPATAVEPERRVDDAAETVPDDPAAAELETRLVATASWARHPGGPLCDEYAACMSQLDVAEHLEPNPRRRLVVAATALPMALIDPASGATNLLDIEVPELADWPGVLAFRKLVADFTRNGCSLYAPDMQRQALQARKLVRIADRAKQIRETAATRTLKYDKATKVYRAWFSPGGRLRPLLDCLEKTEFGTLRGLLDDAHKVGPVRAINETLTELFDKGKPRIVAGARQSLVDTYEEILDMGSGTIAVHQAILDGEQHDAVRRFQRVADFANKAADIRDAVEAELEGPNPPPAVVRLLVGRAMRFHNHLLPAAGPEPSTDWILARPNHPPDATP